ncbi:MAG TPA: response regulator, partial [Pyrinomonadaceae bacterium]|nr:response regulator [Pyrinomonadaceae bacterium]
MPPGRRTLLLADDSPTIRKVISLTFADEGLEVVAVADGQEALRVLERDAPDIVLADTVMPGLDGYGLCERIKGDARFRHIPVMLLVGTFEPFNEAEARRVGADTVLTKPFQSIRDLVSKVGSLLGGGEHKPEDEASSSSAHAGEPGRAASMTADEVLVREADVPVSHRTLEATTTPDEVSTEGEHASGFREEAAPFADIEMDDEMIEARPAEAFGQNAARAEAAEVRSESFGEDETPGFLKMRADLLGEGRARAVAASAAPHEAEESFPSRPGFSARVAEAAAADEALLDLGDLDPPAPVTEADDFILDLADDAPPASAPARAGVAESSFFDEPDFDDAPHADAPSAFAEASHGGEPAREEVPRAFSTAPSGAGWEMSPATAEAFAPDEPQTVDTSAAIVSDAPAVSEEPRADDWMSLSQASSAHEFIEPQVVPADIPVPSEVPVEFTDGSVEGDVAKSPDTAD